MAAIIRGAEIETYFLRISQQISHTHIATGRNLRVDASKLRHQLLGLRRVPERGSNIIRRK